MQRPALDDLYEKYKEDVRFESLRKRYGINFVPGHGTLNPILMLVGEAPGSMENAKQIPFVGTSGKQLNTILRKVGIDINNIFITNAVKYWPQNSKNRGETRPPTEAELTASSEYLRQEIEIVDPIFVGLCGFSAVSCLYPDTKGIYHNNGELLDDRFVVLYHPAASLYAPEKEKLVVAGYTKLKGYIDEYQRSTGALTGQK